MRKSSCDLKTNKRTRIKGEGPRRRLKIFVVIRDGEISALPIAPLKKHL